MCGTGAGITVIVSDEVCWKRSGWRSWQRARLAFLLLPSVSTWSLPHYREDKKNEAVVVFGGDFHPPSLWLTLRYTLSRWMKLKNCSKLLLESTPLYQHIQLVLKTLSSFYHFLTSLSLMISIDHFLCGTWWNLQYNLYRKYIITGKKKFGLFL